MNVPFSPERILARKFAPVEQRYTIRDSIIYALGVGLGNPPTNCQQLRFVYEHEMLALPTMSTVLASQGFWLRDESLGIKWEQVLHGEQGFELHAPLLAEGAVVGTLEVVDIQDRGEKGAYIYSRNVLRDLATGRKIATITSTDICRGDGGFGGCVGITSPSAMMPARAPDCVMDYTTCENIALIYRLSGDMNTLHVDPVVAKVAGFEAPILHGLCTFGIAGHALLREVCDYDPARLTAMKVRFTAPVYPGDTIRTELWRDGSTVMFRSSVPERGVIVLNNGSAAVCADSQVATLIQST